MDRLNIVEYVNNKWVIVVIIISPMQPNHGFPISMNHHNFPIPILVFQDDDFFDIPFIV